MTIRRLALALILIAGAAPALSSAPRAAPGAPSEAQRPGPGADAHSLSGLVVSADESALPLRRAVVMLSSTDGDLARTLVADDFGRFRFAALPAGRYFLSASQPAYLTTSYGAAFPGRSGMPIALTAGQSHPELVIRLIRGAVITGLVLDEHGEPAARQVVSALRTRVVDGVTRLVRTPVMAATAGFDSPVTDDRGVYRLYGLPPGEYLVAAGRPPVSSATTLRQMSPAAVQRAMRLLQEPAGAVARGQGPRRPPAQQVGLSGAPDAEPSTLSYAPVYYPGTLVASSAASVTLRAGEERAGVDIALQLVHTSSLEGSVLGSDGQPAEGVLVHVISREPQTEWLRLPPAVSVAADGRFSVSSLTPGQYTVEARTRPTAQTQEKPMWASADMTVVSGQPSRAALTLEPCATISGRIVFVSTTQAAPPALPVRITLSPAERVPGTWLGERTVTTADGRFTIPDVVPGRYRLGASLASADPARIGSWAFTAAAVGGQPAADTPVDVKSGEVAADAVVTFVDESTELTGRLENRDGSPASSYSVVAFPKDRALWFWQSRRIRSAHLASDGTFVFRDLPAGQYHVVIVTDVAADEWFDPAFLEALVPGAIAVELVNGERKVLAFQVRR